MNILSEDEIWKEFWRRYLKKPEGWRMRSGISEKGNPELLISGRKESWLIKRESLYSGRMGVGAKIGGINKMNSTIDSFGLRELPMDILETIASSADPVDSSKIFTDIIRNQTPTTPRKIRAPVMIQGPIMQSSNPLNLMSDKQVELDKKLDLELMKWTKKIPYIG